jgi:uncharacterized coiled-coil protein SlyX
MADSAQPKLRIGRVLFVLAAILLGYSLITWVQGNTSLIHSTDKSIKTLSMQLEEQKQLVTQLNRGLSEFSMQLNALNQKLDGFARSDNNNRNYFR